MIQAIFPFLSHTDEAKDTMAINAKFLVTNGTYPPKKKVEFGILQDHSLQLIYAKALSRERN